MGINKALITGASSGIGKELAIVLADQAIALILVGQNKTALAELQESLSQKVAVSIVVADLATQSGLQALFQIIEDELPDLVINNAGIGLYGDLITQEPTGIQKIIDLNISALVAISTHAAHTLKERGQSGVLVNVSSVLSFFISPGAAVYAASKSFVNQFSLALDFEMAPFGIRVLVSAPGQVATNFRSRASQKPQKQEGIVLDAKQVANAIWGQVKSKKSIEVIDWKYKVLVSLSKILPLSLITKRLAATLRSR